MSYATQAKNIDREVLMAELKGLQFSPKAQQTITRKDYLTDYS